MTAADGVGHPRTGQRSELWVAGEDGKPVSGQRRCRRGEPPKGLEAVGLELDGERRENQHMRTFGRTVRQASLTITHLREPGAALRPRSLLTTVAPSLPMKHTAYAWEHPGTGSPGAPALRSIADTESPLLAPVRFVVCEAALKVFCHH